VAESFRANETIDTETVLLELETGEALISFLDEKGAPRVVERAKMLCPQGQIGPIAEEERQTIIKSCCLEQKYGEVMDRASAYEYFKNLEEKKKAEEERLRLEKEEEEREEREREKERKTSKKKSSKSETNSFWNKVIIPIAKSFGNQLVRNLMKKMK
jgi:hypothetical protein